MSFANSDAYWGGFNCVTQLLDALEFSDEAAKRTVEARQILIVFICFELLISRSFYTAVVDEDACSTVVAVAISSKSLRFSLPMSSTCVLYVHESQIGSRHSLPRGWYAKTLPALDPGFLSSCMLVCNFFGSLHICFGWSKILLH